MQLVLIPQYLWAQFPGTKSTIVQCLVPTHETLDGSITIRATRLAPGIWRLYHTPLRWWQRRPKIAISESPLIWREPAVFYRWARVATISTRESVLSRFALSNDVRVLAYSKLDQGQDINQLLRRVLFVRADAPLEGVTTKPDANCVVLNVKPASQHNIEAVALLHANFHAELEGRAKGWILHPHHHVWVPPEQLAAEQKYADEQDQFRRRAGV